MPAKVCPRCGAVYDNLKSTTCPQCFAKLEVVDETTAEELIAARAEVERTPEFQQVKAADDERFREQSFGACLGVIALFLVVIVLAVTFIVTASRRSRHSAHQLTAAATSRPATSLDILTPLPVAAATIDDVLPAQVGAFTRTERDQNTTLSGTLTPIFSGTYVGRQGRTVQVYAVPTSLSTPLQNQFRQGVELTAQLLTKGAAVPTFAPTQTFATEHWRYAVIGPPSSTADTTFVLDDFRQALAAHFRSS